MDSWGNSFKRRFLCHQEKKNKLNISHLKKDLMFLEKLLNSTNHSRDQNNKDQIVNRDQSNKKSVKMLSHEKKNRNAKTDNSRLLMLKISFALGRRKFDSLFNLSDHLPIEFLIN